MALALVDLMGGFFWYGFLFFANWFEQWGGGRGQKKRKRRREKGKSLVFQ